MAIFNSDSYRMYRRSQWGIGICLLLLVSVWRSCSEIELSWKGETTTARVVTVRPSDYNERDQFVRFMFKPVNGGNVETAGHRVKNPNPRIVAGDEIEVIYPRSRPDLAKPTSERSFGSLYLLIFAVGAMIVWCAFAIRRVEQGRPA